MSKKYGAELPEGCILILVNDNDRLLTITTLDNNTEYEAIPMFRTGDAALAFLERNYPDNEDFFAVMIDTDNLEEQMIVPPLFNIGNSEKVRARIAKLKGE